MPEKVTVAKLPIEAIQDSDSKQILTAAISAAAEVKAFDIAALDVAGVFGLADYFVLVSGRSDRHVQGIVNKITHDLSQKGIKPIAVEGMDKAHWVLIDYGNVLIHIFYEQVRYVYNLENLWINSAQLELTDLLKSINEKVAA